MSETQTRDYTIPDNIIDMQQMVHNFMVAGEQIVGYSPGLRDQLLRIRLMSEESAETCRAVYNGNVTEAIDGLCDILYVVLGTAVAFGIDIYPFFAEVHRSNMAKIDSVTGHLVKDEYGKVIKPKGWTPPDIAGVYQKVYGCSIDTAQVQEQSHDEEWMSVIRLAKASGLRPADIAHYIIKKEG